MLNWPLDHCGADHPDNIFRETLGEGISKPNDCESMYRSPSHDHQDRDSLESRGPIVSPPGKGGSSFIRHFPSKGESTCRTTFMHTGLVAAGRGKIPSAGGQFLLPKTFTD